MSKKKDSLFIQLMKDKEFNQNFNTKKAEFENNYFNAAVESGLGKDLLSLEKKTLVKALLEACHRHEDIHVIVDRLLSSTKENHQRFKLRLEEYRDSNRFVPWKYSDQFAKEIEDLLEDLKLGAETPKEGIELLKLFFEADEAIINCCDDSSGMIGNVFTYDAVELFEIFAAACEDKEFIIETICELVAHNDYGLRDGLTSNIGNFLTTPYLRKLADIFLEDGQYSYVEDVAKGLKDPILFEKAVSGRGTHNKSYNNYKIGEMYLECGDASEALTYLQNVKERDHFSGDIHDLLKRAYLELGNSSKVKEAVWNKFKSYRSVNNFESVVDIEGEEKRFDLLADEIKRIHKEIKLNDQSVEFLFSFNLVEDVDKYIYKRVKDLDGDCGYYSMSDWAITLEKEGKLLTSTLIYRELLSSILDRGYAKAYHYGVDYLKCLERQANKIEEWKKHKKHEQYFNQIHEQHKRKRNFWSRYRGEYR